MRCPKCNYFFYEGIKICPRCGADMGIEIEKLGIFPPLGTEPLLTPEDFMEFSEENNIRRSIEIPFPSETS